MEETSCLFGILAKIKFGNIYLFTHDCTDNVQKSWEPETFACYGYQLDMVFNWFSLKPTNVKLSASNG